MLNCVSNPGYVVIIYGLVKFLQDAYCSIVIIICSFTAAVKLSCGIARERFPAGF